LLRQETAFPESEISTIRITLEQPTTFALRFRVPGWCAEMSITVNGNVAVIHPAPGAWARIEPMALRTLPADRQHPDRVAILYGPVVLAQDEACCRRSFALEPGARCQTVASFATRCLYASTSLISARSATTAGYSRCTASPASGHTGFTSI